MAEITLDIVRWAAEECERQMSGEMSVYHMLTAWTIVTNSWRTYPITEAHIIQLGKMIEPDKNANGYRHVPVLVNGNPALRWADIPRQMGLLIHYQPDIGERTTVANGGSWISIADSWYKQFEEVHPFTDGNGRTGSILWNWLNGTLRTPKAPPNFWEN